MKKSTPPAVKLLILVVTISIMATGCKKTDEPETVTDIDGNVYKTIVIGPQIWMAENLKTKKLNDGTSIALESVNNEWENLYSQNTPGYCWHDNNPSNGNIYGALYNYAAVKSGKLCPAGWHVPFDAEWQALRDFAGGENIAGGKLKERGTAHWNSPNTGANDEFGFTALPGGERYESGDFHYLGINTNFWSRSGKKTTEPLGVRIYYDNQIFHMSGFHEGMGLSALRIES